MRKLVTAAAAVAVLCGMTALAQTPTKPPMASDEHIMMAHGEAELLHRALLESKHDPETLKLLDQALTDRTTMLQAELDRTTKAVAYVKAMRGGDKAAIQETKDALKGSLETVAAAAKTFSADCWAIREHLRSMREDEGKRAHGSSGAPAVTNP